MLGCTGLWCVCVVVCVCVCVCVCVWDVAASGGRLRRLARVINNPYLQEREVDSVFLARHERDSVSTGSREYNNGSGAVAGRMHAKV